MTLFTPGALVFADGTHFSGEFHGPAHPASGEVVFNTVMHGYQEVITDPSYAGQIVVFTSTHIGNYGVVAADNESRRPWCRAVVVRDLAERASSWRCEEELVDFLARWETPALSGVDTRRLTRYLRTSGAAPAAMGVLRSPSDLDHLAELAAAEPGTTGMDLVAEVTTEAPYVVAGDQGDRYLVVIDYGVKSSILANLALLGQVEVVPAATPAAEVLARRPDGVVLSNGPGDPAALPWAVEGVRPLLGEIPVLAICLGHQLVGAALGGSTFKLAFGHHGGNHPVQRLSDGSVEITSQNHNYAVSAESLEASGAVITHLNLNDGVVEGFEVPDAGVIAVQYHPEAGPGPHDALWIFRRFADLMGTSSMVAR
jgi:carbamoyl-phosphate synthase small subunit